MFFQKKQLDVSVVVVVYNQGYTAKLILQSLLDQTTHCHYEIIITDDGSAYNLLEVVKSLSKRSKIPIHYIWQQHKGTPTVAKNDAIKIARGKILLFLEGDMIPEEDLLEKHLLAHQKSKTNLIVAGNRLWRGLINPKSKKILENKNINSVRRMLASGWDTDKESSERERIEKIRRKEWFEYNPWRICFGCNLSVKNTKDIYLDENFFKWGSDDWELAYRLYKKGYQPIYLEKAIAYHLESKQSLTKGFRTHKQEDIINNIKNTFYFYDKCPGLSLKEVFFSFPRYSLDTNTNKWRILPRRDNYTHEELREKVYEIRKWFRDNGIYNSKREI